MPKFDIGIQSMWLIHTPCWSGRLTDRAAAIKAGLGESTTSSVGLKVTGSGVAVIDVQDELSKAGGWNEGSSTVAVKAKVRAAANDPEVRGILLMIDSPGGDAHGTQELADEVKRAASMKPVHAHIDDMGASAAYWIASQTLSISANRTAMIGCLGTVWLIYDYSKLFEEEGIRPVLISTGEFKGAGVPGTEITEAHQEYFQGLVDGLTDLFMTDVATGRGMDRSSVDAIADGRVHFAADALGLGLIDKVQSSEEAVREIEAVVAAATSEGNASAQAVYRVRRSRVG